MRTSSAALLMVLTIADVHAAEVYRCIANGVTHYQEKPCSGVVLSVNPERTGVGGLRDSEVSAYLDSVERDVYRIAGPRQSQQLDTVNGHITILRRIVD